MATELQKARWRKAKQRWRRGERKERADQTRWLSKWQTFARVLRRHGVKWKGAGGVQGEYR